MVEKGGPESVECCTWKGLVAALFSRCKDTTVLR